MTRIPELPPRMLTDEEIAAFHRDGVVCVRGLYSPQWVKHLEEALDEIYDTPSPIAQANAGVSRNRGDVYSWLHFDRVRDFVLFGPTAHLARQVFDAKKINLFMDQIFIKEAGTPEGTPWHHDFTFWSLEGNDIASVWTSVDAVDAESSALEFIAGSHKWGKRFKAYGLLPGMVMPGTENFEEIPDVDGGRDQFDVLSWELEPGDGLLFHALTLHGARPNASKTIRRRAITTRWCGDDVVFKFKGGPVPWDHGLTDGDPLDGFVFPRVLPEIDEDAIAARMRGPVPPDMGIIKRFQEMAGNFPKGEPSGVA